MEKHLVPNFLHWKKAKMVVVEIFSQKTTFYSPTVVFFHILTVQELLWCEMLVSVLWKYCMRRPSARRRGGGAIEFLFLGEPARSKRAARRDHEGGRRHHHHRLHHHHRNHRRHRRCLLFSTTGASPLCIVHPSMHKVHIFIDNVKNISLLV